MAQSLIITVHQFGPDGHLHPVAGPMEAKEYFAAKDASISEENHQQVFARLLKAGNEGMHNPPQKKQKGK